MISGSKPTEGTLENITFLSDIVSSIHIRYAKIRRKEILTRARELLNADYHNTMLASGDMTEVCVYSVSVCISIYSVYMMFMRV